MIPAVKAYVRPDGRHFVEDPDPEFLAEATTDLYCTVEASEVDSYLALGFDVHRREGTYLVPIRSARVDVPQGVVFAPADEVDETSLRLLDNELRQDVPGTNGWQWDEADFREETYEAAEFDPKTYLVALDGETGEYVGIVRVWMKQPTPGLASSVCVGATDAEALRAHCSLRCSPASTNAAFTRSRQRSTRRTQRRVRCSKGSVRAAPAPQSS